MLLSYFNLLAFISQALFTEYDIMSHLNYNWLNPLPTLLPEFTSMIIFISSYY